MGDRRTWRFLIGIGLAASVFASGDTPATARAPRTTTVPVTMVDNSFSPRDVAGVVGFTGVSWHNGGTVFHSATTSRHPRWFDVVLDEGQNGETVMRFAGTFPYGCRYHEDMRGSLSVSPRLEPPGGSAGDTLSLVLASEDPSATGFAFDIQRRRDDRTWVDLGRVTSATAAESFGRAGTFAFRARLVDVARDRAGRWSPPIVAEITA